MIHCIGMEVRRVQWLNNQSLNPTRTGNVLKQEQTTAPLYKSEHIGYDLWLSLRITPKIKHEMRYINIYIVLRLQG